MLTQRDKEIGKETRLSMDRVIDLIREVRNGLIQDFLNDESARNYFRERYNKELSNIRGEFLKRDLKELESSPVDLSHYGSLIKQIQETNSASLTSDHQDLFFYELERIFRKYNY